MIELCGPIWCALIGFFRSQNSLEAETLVLRHQLNILRRKLPERPNLANIDRLVFAGLFGLVPRFALLQMDVPTCTSYVMAVVTPAERATAASVTAVPRSLASAVGPAFAGVMLSSAFLGLPLVVCGILKIVYDLALLFSFRQIKPP